MVEHSFNPIVQDNEAGTQASLNYIGSACLKTSKQPQAVLSLEHDRYLGKGTVAIDTLPLHPIHTLAILPIQCPGLLGLIELGSLFKILF